MLQAVALSLGHREQAPSGGGNLGDVGGDLLVQPDVRQRDRGQRGNRVEQPPVPEQRRVVLQHRDALATVQQVGGHLARLWAQGDWAAGLVDEPISGHQTNDDRRVAERIGHQIAEGSHRLGPEIDREVGDDRRPRPPVTVVEYYHGQHSDQDDLVRRQERRIKFSPGRPREASGCEQAPDEYGSRAGEIDRAPAYCGARTSAAQDRNDHQDEDHDRCHTKPTDRIDQTGRVHGSDKPALAAPSKAGAGIEQEQVSEGCTMGEHQGLHQIRGKPEHSCRCRKKGELAYAPQQQRSQQVADSHQHIECDHEPTAWSKVCSESSPLGRNARAGVAASFRR